MKGGGVRFCYEIWFGEKKRELS